MKTVLGKSQNRKLFQTIFNELVNFVNVRISQMEIDKSKLIENLTKIFAANENDVNNVRLWVSEPHVLSHVLHAN